MSNKVFFGITGLVIVILFALAISISGCASLGNFIGGNSPDDIEDPGTSSGRMWQTIKDTKNNLFTSWAIPIIAIGCVVVFNGMAKIGFSVIMFGSINLFVSLATAKFALPMAVFGFVGTVLAVLASVLLKNKAIKDMICGIQKIKVTAKDDNVDLVFRDKIKDVLSDQLVSTKKIVKKVKSKLKLVGQMTSTKSE